MSGDYWNDDPMLVQRCRHDPRWAAEAITKLREMAYLNIDPFAVRDEHKDLLKTCAPKDPNS